MERGETMERIVDRRRIKSRQTLTLQTQRSQYGSFPAQLRITPAGSLRHAHDAPDRRGPIPARRCLR
jgi:hypothetical protein